MTMPIRKTAAFLLLAMLFVTSLNANLCYARYVKIANGTIAKVVDVLDGDSIVVRNIFNKQLSLVHLLGVDTNGSDEALSYLTTRLLGRTVTLHIDYNALYSLRWSYAYVSLNNDNINEELIFLGLGKLDRENGRIRQYDILLAAEDYARLSKLGLWGKNFR